MKHYIAIITNSTDKKCKETLSRFLKKLDEGYEIISAVPNGEAVQYIIRQTDAKVSTRAQSSIPEKADESLKSIYQ